jgi:hypothetical protein
MRVLSILLLAIPAIISLKMKVRKDDNSKCEDMTNELNCGMLPHCYYDTEQNKCLRMLDDTGDSNTRS